MKFNSRDLWDNLVPRALWVITSPDLCSVTEEEINLMTTGLECESNSHCFFIHSVS